MEKSPQEELKDIDKLFSSLAKNKGSDLHLKVGAKVIFRVTTVLHEVGNKVLSATDIKRIIYEIMTDSQKNIFEHNLNLDFAYDLEGVGRFRINIYQERGNVAVAARRVNTGIPSLNDLHLPPVIQEIASLKEGLIIVSGPTSSGKSTTLASMIQYINENRKCHIITIEDPIEYLFKDNKSFINQREIGIDVASFEDALKYVVRQNPDVILIGEIRDSKSVEAALMAAETGHLVLGTIHASNAAQTISRIIDLFPQERSNLIRQSITLNLKSIICQRLLPSSKKEIRIVPMAEVLVVNPTIQKLIQTKEDKLILEIMRGSKNEGMQDFNISLHNLIKNNLITDENALKFSHNPDQLKMLLKGISLTDEHKILG
ncbi:MAG: PilT/PilU family type 4a pilus ATPase [Candidatus Brocadiia bacterium]